VGVVAVPLLALLMPVEVAAPLAVLLSITVAGVVVAQDWHKVQVRSAGRLILFTLFGCQRRCVGIDTSRYGHYAAFLRDDALTRPADPVVLFGPGAEGQGKLLDPDPLVPVGQGPGGRLAQVTPLLAPQGTVCGTHPNSL
jgi:hypothetical protein